MPELPTTTRGAATSQRILDAAAAEFADRGIAGARIDRIIAAARTNKAQLYSYFGSKDGLFDAVIADRSYRLLSVIPFDANDLPRAPGHQLLRRPARRARPRARPPPGPAPRLRPARRDTPVTSAPQH